MQSFTQRDLLNKGEETVDYGGYFIVNGIERLIRLLIVPKRHYVTCLIRPSYQNRGAEYSKFATSMRCVRAGVY
jgi:DNA-directed RNA polymerase I subunit RPA2